MKIFCSTPSSPYNSSWEMEQANNLIETHGVKTVCLNDCVCRHVFNPIRSSWRLNNVLDWGIYAILHYMLNDWESEDWNHRGSGIKKECRIHTNQERVCFVPWLTLWTAWSSKSENGNVELSPRVTSAYYNISAGLYPTYGYMLSSVSKSAMFPPTRKRRRDLEKLQG